MNSYKYETHKPELFTDEGQKMFLSFRDNVLSLLDMAGAFRLDKVKFQPSWSSWDCLVCADRMVELGEIQRISPPGTWGQYQVFISKKDKQ